MQPTYQDDPIMRVADIHLDEITPICTDYGLELKQVDDDADIPGSYWQAPEAGLVGKQLFVRRDTPIHSLLHEGCHFICMDSARRMHLHTDAGGEFIEENAVCYLQILLADRINAMGSVRMMRDMDQWGYSFRLGSAQAWFEQDAEDARAWLQAKGIIDLREQPTGHCCP
jgi:hypothetical protein